MKTLALTRHERSACLLTLGFVAIATVMFFSLTQVVDETPYRLCPLSVSIMTTTTTDIICR